MSKLQLLEDEISVTKGERSCLNCALFSSCKNKSKSYSFICLKHKPIIDFDLTGYGNSNQENVVEPFKFNPDKEESFDLDEFINSIIKGTVPLHKDVKVDTSDIPQAPNFFTFAIDSRYLNILPYPKQFEIACEYLNEVCWRCSNKEWRHNWPYRATLDDIRENITFFEFGICPKCGRRKSSRINKGWEIAYNQLAAKIGQRCVVGSTKLQLDMNTQITFDELFKYHENKEGFQPYKGPNILVYADSGFEFVKPSNFYYSKNQDVYEVKISKRFTLFGEETIDYNTSITGTAEHPLLCLIGGMYRWIKMGDLSYYGSCIKGIASIDFNLDSIQNTKIISVCPIDSITYKGKQDVFDIEVPKYHSFIGNNLVNHNSGKSFISVAMGSYSIHWLLKTPNLMQLFGLAPHSQLHTVYLALTIRQIKESVFDSLYTLLNSSPWFISMKECLDYYGRRYGEQLYAIKDTFYRFRTCNLLGFVSTPDYRSLRGHTSVGVSVFDEVGLMHANKENSIKYNVDQVHKSVLNSYRTTNSGIKKLYEQGYDNVLNNCFANISSPYSTNDKIMRLVKQAKEIKTIYGVTYKSFEFNPNFTYESFEDERLANYSDYMRDIECIPPMSANPYIDNLEYVKDCFKQATNAVQLDTVEFTTKTGKEMSCGELKINWLEDKTPKILAIDAGRTNNSFSLALAHLTEDNVPQFDAMVEIIPAKGKPINYTKVYKQVISSIIEKYNVVMVVADRWNSAKILDDIEDNFNIETEQFSVKYKDFSNFKEDLLNSNLNFPRLKELPNLDSIELTKYPQNMRGDPIKHFAVQLVTVQDYGDRSVEKGESFTDDIFRATVLAYSYLTDPEYKDKFKGTLIQSRVGGLGAIGGRGAAISSNIGARPSGVSTNSNLGVKV